jgi:multidrug efflux pump subunit AcrB
MSTSNSHGSGNGGNVAHYFVTHPQVGWVLLVVLLFGGIIGYARMPKRKDPEIPVRVAVVAVAWPGARAELVEQAITRRLEAKVAENEHVDKIESTTRTGVSIVKVTLTTDVQDTGKEFDDISARVGTLRDWPQGAYPPEFKKDFGSTVALMLTVASPPMPDLEAHLRARSIRDAIDTHRRGRARGAAKDIVFAFPGSLERERLRPVVERVRHLLGTSGAISGDEVVEDSGFFALEVDSSLSPELLERRTARALLDVLPEGESHPDMWPPFAVASLDEIDAAFRRIVGPRYSFKELDDFTELLEHRLQRVDLVSKVARTGLLPEQITLDYSQERLADAGVSAQSVAQAIAAHNVNLPGGVLDVDGRNVPILTSGELATVRDLENVLVTTTSAGAPIRLGDLFDVGREYQAPRLLNTYSWKDGAGVFRSSRAITLAVSMRSGSQVGDFGAKVDAALANARALLPPDLVIARPSDQPRQVAENVALFNGSLGEAIVLVVIIALVGFMSWRTATILALAIPITLAMTYAVMSLIGWDLQQISISTMILALGLLVDVPVVASDAIVSAMSQGESKTEAAWRGPTRLSIAILFATVTNIVAYLPFLGVHGDVGRFIRSLPVVMTIALLGAWTLSMTFVPMFGALLLAKPKRVAPSLAQRRTRGFGRVYSNAATWAIRNRGLVVVIAVALVAAAIPAIRELKTAFFPKDLSYLSYVDVWAPEDSTVSETKHIADRAAAVVDRTLAEWGRLHPGPDGKPRDVLESVTTFVGGGGPRFWFSVTPELEQANYAQLVIQVNDKHVTNQVVGDLQRALDEVAGARIDVRQLEMAKPVGIPVSVRLAGEDVPTLERYAERVRAIFDGVPIAARTRDDWGTRTLAMNVTIDADRAANAGITHQDIALSSAASHGGQIIGSIRENDTSIPIVARLRATERVGVSDLDNLYVTSARTGQRIPLAQVADIQLASSLERIQRRNHARTITIAGFPRTGTLPSEVMAAARPGLDRLRAELPPGYELEVGGEEEEQVKGFGDLTAVLAISVAAIFVALTVQFKSAIKPLIVFATIPLGAVGALVSLRIMNAPFGFMAFLGIISLIGVIVSHVIVLFDFIEERREQGATLEDALVEAGIQRLRPVLITVVATVAALFPLAAHGGPLWEPLCYAQIGGLSVATFVTLLLVPAVYAIFVKDLHVLGWTAATIAP